MSTKFDSEKIDITYGRLFQLKKDFHDLEHSFENITKFGLNLADIKQLNQSEDVPEEIKEVTNHPSIMAAANLKTAYQRGSLNNMVGLLNPSTAIETKKSNTSSSSTSSSKLDKYTIDPKDLPQLPNIENRRIYQTVFTHSSAANSTKYDVHESYERLEFLGDSVLNNVISVLLFTKFPEYQEGLLTELRSIIVCNKNLTQWSLAYGFDRNLVSNLNPLEPNMAHKKLYGDIFEAYVGGLYLDSNRELHKITPWLTRLASPIIEKFASLNPVEQVPTIIPTITSEPKPVQQDLTKYDISTEVLPANVKHCKEDLYVLLNPMFVPSYELLEKLDAEHKPTFRVACVVNGEVLGVAIAGNKKDAGSKAAYDALTNNKQKVDKYAAYKTLAKRGGPTPLVVTTPIEIQIAQGIYDTNSMPY